MKYPRFPQNLDLRIKVTDDVLKLIHALYKQGWSKRAISRKVQVHHSTIYYHLSSDEYKKRYREQSIVKSRARIEEVRNDPALKIKVNDWISKSKRRKYAIQPEFVEYDKAMAAKHNKSPQGKEWFRKYRKAQRARYKELTPLKI